jgi:hypothetical protein
MDPLMIYILDNTIETRLLYDQLNLVSPLTKEQVVDLIISKIESRDEANYKAFLEKFDLLSYKYLSINDKINLLREELNELERCHRTKRSWSDPKELKSDLLNTEFSYHKLEDKTILYNRQIEDWIIAASGWMVLSKKKEYLVEALNSLLNSEIEEKQVAEKWYALLHIILMSLNKKDPITDYSDMKEIMKLGKSQYKLKTSGQGFYREIINIRKSKPAVYISNLTLKNRKIMKPLLVKISGNDADVILYLKNLPN